MSYMYRRFSFRFSAMMAVAVVGGLHAGSARANATGGSVVAGHGAINQAGSTTTIDQRSPTLILNWQGFSISPSETVQFVQPSATSVALNRVIGNEPSLIQGHLLANGQVFLINPNGVLFGRGATVDVGGLVASSLDLGDSDFLAGHYRFRGSSTPASIVNQGDITASGGGSVALLGGQVINQGIIRAQLGTVALAAGSAVTLDFVGNHLLNVQVDQEAAKALAANHQLIQADGGKVIMTAAARDALLDTVVNNDGVIEARTIQNQGGKIELLGGKDGGTVQVGGTLDASAPSGGDGGAIETSGETVRVSDGAQITTAAAAGKTGSWLVDPTDFTISPSGGDISGATLDTELASNNVALSSTQGSRSGNGDIFVDDTVSWSANTTLTMTAARNIYINSSITATGNTAGIALNYGTAAGDNYYLNYGSWVTLSGTSPSVSIENIPYTVINSVGSGPSDNSGTTLQGIQNNLAGHYALVTDINGSATGSWTLAGTGNGFQALGYPGNTFTGTLAGLGHVISSLTVDPAYTPDGLFGYADTGSTIRDVELRSGTLASTSSYDYVGALVGENYGTIINALSSMTVSGNSFVGGLVGENYGTITSSHASGAVTGYNNATGGLVGGNEVSGTSIGSVSSSYATGSVDNKNTEGGGLVGDNAGTVSASWASGAVTSINGTDGGLVGNNSGTISGSYASGGVTSPAAGGLVGANLSGARIETSYYVTGTVNGGSSNDIGGLVGENQGSIDQSYASAATVVGNANVGGLVGWQTATGTITNSYATGRILGTAGNVGAFVGDNIGSINDSYAALAANSGSAKGFIGGTDSGTTTGSYWLKSGTTQDSSAAMPLTAAQSQQEASYAGWNFNSIWRIYDGHTMPLLKTFLTPLTITTTNIYMGYIDAAYPSGLSTPVYSIHGADTSGHLQGLGSPYANDFNAGTYTPDLWSDQQGYDISVTPNSLHITPEPLEITTANVTKSYDGTTSAAGSAELTGGTQLFGSDSISGGVFAYSNANAGIGDKTVTTSGVTVSDGNGGNNYTVTYVDNTTSTINPAPLEITTASVTKTYDGTTSAVGSLAVTAGTKLFGGDTISGGVFAFNDANAGIGDKIVTTSGATVNDGNGGNNYVVSYVDNTTSTINPAPLDITTANVTKVYDGTTSAAGSAEVTGGTQLFGSDSISGGVFAYSNANAGIGDKTVTTSGVTVSDGNGGNNYTVTYVNNRTSTINPAPLEITTASVTKTYDGTTSAAGSLALTGGTKLFGGDTISGGVFAFNDANAGIGDKIVTTSGATVNDGNGGNNYAVSYVDNTTSTINPAPLDIATANVTKTYDGTTSAIGNPVVTGGTKLFGSDSLSGGLFAYTDKNAGIGDKTVTTSGVTISDGNGGKNYAVTYVDNTASTIAAAVLDITTANVTKSYDGTTSVVGGSAVATGGTKLFGSDSLSGGVFAYTNANAGIGDKAVTTSGVTVNDGNSGNNYAVTYVDNTVSTITPAPLEITTANVTKTYDGTTGAAGSLAVIGGTQLFGGDTISGGVFAYTDKNAGIGDKIVTTSGVTVNDGNSGNNYSVSYVDNTTSTIEKAPLALAAQSSTKTYDGTSASDGLVAAAGNVSGDAVSATEAYTSGEVRGAGGSTLKVARYSITDAAGADMSGNYDVTTTTAAGTIDPAAITVSGITAQSKAYDGTTSATLNTNGVMLAGRISGDDVGVSAAGRFADGNAGIDKAVSLSLTLTGPASGNYVLASTGNETSTTANISPDALTITANDATRVSGQPNPPLTLSYSGFVAGQTASSLTTLPTEWTTADTKSAVGTYPINVSGAVDSNYVFTYVPGVLTVTDGGAAAQVGSPSYVGAVASVGSSDAEGGLSSGAGLVTSTDSKASTGAVCGPTADANCAKPDVQRDASSKALGKRFVSGLSLEIIADGMRLPAGVL